MTTKITCAGLHSMRPQKHTTKDADNLAHCDCNTIGACKQTCAGLARKLLQNRVGQGLVLVKTPLCSCSDDPAPGWCQTRVSPVHCTSQQNAIALSVQPAEVKLTAIPPRPVLPAKPVAMYACVMLARQTVCNMQHRHRQDTTGHQASERVVTVSRMRLRRRIQSLRPRPL